MILTIHMCIDIEHRTIERVVRTHLYTYCVAARAELQGNY
jgi:hypothetical protein